MDSSASAAGHRGSIIRMLSSVMYLLCLVRSQLTTRAYIDQTVTDPEKTGGYSYWRGVEILLSSC